MDYDDEPVKQVLVYCGHSKDELAVFNEMLNSKPKNIFWYFVIPKIIINDRTGAPQYQKDNNTMISFPRDDKQFIFDIFDDIIDRNDEFERFRDGLLGDVEDNKFNMDFVFIQCGINNFVNQAKVDNFITNINALLSNTGSVLIPYENEVTKELVRTKLLPHFNSVEIMSTERGQVIVNWLVFKDKKDDPMEIDGGRKKKRGTATRKRA